MTERFLGATALVTGAASGIGAAVVERLTGEGARVVAVDRDASALTGLYRHRDAVSWTECDLSEPVRDDLVASAGDVSILVNAAGVLRRSPFLDHSLTDWQETCAVNLSAPHRLAQQFVRHRLERGGGGAIVNVCSIESFTAAPEHAAYTVTKSALMMLTKAFALELAPHDIRVNAIAPGVTATNMNAALRSDPARAARLLSGVPMRRFGTPQEQAATVAFLASDEASYVTGAILPVDGGWLTQ